MGTSSSTTNFTQVIKNVSSLSSTWILCNTLPVDGMTGKLNLEEQAQLNLQNAAQELRAKESAYLASRERYLAAKAELKLFTALRAANEAHYLFETRKDLRSLVDQLNVSHESNEKLEKGIAELVDRLEQQGHGSHLRFQS